MTEQSDLEAFAALLRKWNAVHNLVSRETLAQLWPRHIEDSLQLAPLLRDSDLRILDIGSGGGFPAIPLAIATRGQGRRFVLLEPVQKKAAFLRTVIRELQLPAEVHAVRAEAFDSRETIDVVTSRALADLPDLLRLGVRFVGPNTRLLLHKGLTYREEASRASRLFNFDMVIHPSRTDAAGVILEISNLRAKSAV